MAWTVLPLTLHFACMFDNRPVEYIPLHHSMLIMNQNT